MCVSLPCKRQRTIWDATHVEISEPSVLRLGVLAEVCDLENSSRQTRCGRTAHTQQHTLWLQWQYSSATQLLAHILCTCIQIYTKGSAAQIHVIHQCARPASHLSYLFMSLLLYQSLLLSSGGWGWGGGGVIL